MLRLEDFLRELEKEVYDRTWRRWLAPQATIGLYKYIENTFAQNLIQSTIYDFLPSNIQWNAGETFPSLPVG